jgi:hypothetical protein
VASRRWWAGQVFNGRRTSLRAGSASQVFARLGTASEDKDAGHRPGDSASVGHAFKACLPHQSWVAFGRTPDKVFRPPNIRNRRKDSGLLRVACSPIDRHELGDADHTTQGAVRSCCQIVVRGCNRNKARGVLSR